MTNPVHPSGYLISNHFDKGGYSFRVMRTQYGKCRSVWCAIDTLKWKDRKGNKRITIITRRDIMKKFNE